MLKQKLFFKFFWSTMRFFGLQPHKINTREKARALLFVTVLAITNFILYFISLALNDDIEARINSLQTLPFFIQIFLECLNFALKSKDIEEMFNKVNDFFIEVNGGDFLSHGYFYFIIYYAFNAFLAVTSTFGCIVIFLTTRESPVPIYTPTTQGWGFFLIWAIQSSFLVYSGLLIYLLDQMLISLLIFLSFCLKALRRKIQTEKASDLIEIVRLHLKIKRYFLRFKSIFL